MRKGSNPNPIGVKPPPPPNPPTLSAQQPEPVALDRALCLLRDEVLEMAARECDQKAKSWAESVAEGSEQEAYEISVLNDVAAAIRRLKVAE